MAIAFNLPGIPSQIKGTPEEAGAMPDLSQAIMKGFTTALDTANKPRTMAQEYLGKQLENKIQGTKAKYIDELMQAQIAKLRQPSAELALLPLRADLLKAQAERNRRLGAGANNTFALKRMYGANALDYLSPIIEEQPYVGTFSSTQLANDIYKYKMHKDEDAKNRLIKFAVAGGVVPEHTSGALASQGLSSTIPAIEHQRTTTTQGWPSFYEKQISALPKEIQEEAKKQIIRHQQNIKNMQQGGAIEQGASDLDPLGLFE